MGARVADALVGVVGLAGVALGGLLLSRGAWIEAVLVWALTFVAGAALRLLASMARAISEVRVRLRTLTDRQRRAPDDESLADEWGRRHLG